MPAIKINSTRYNITHMNAWTRCERADWDEHGTRNTQRTFIKPISCASQYIVEFVGHSTLSKSIAGSKTCVEILAVEDTR